MPSNKPRWTSEGLCTIGNTVVGTVLKAANDLYYAHGCMDDWEDVNLGPHPNQREAKKAVENWVEKHS